MTALTATDLFREFTYPLRSVSTLITLLTFFVLGVLIDPAFRPQADDLPLAIAAAQQCGNKELASALNR